MKIRVVIESDQPFNPEDIMDWLNTEFAMYNMGTGDNMVAVSYEVVEDGMA